MGGFSNIRMVLISAICFVLKHKNLAINPLHWCDIFIQIFKEVEIAVNTRILNCITMVQNPCEEMDGAETSSIQRQHFKFCESPACLSFPLFFPVVHASNWPPSLHGLNCRMDRESDRECTTLR